MRVIIAGQQLREQAIKRTQKEILEPHQTWGISGTFVMQTSGLSAGVIRARATNRLAQIQSLAA